MFRTGLRAHVAPILGRCCVQVNSNIFAGLFNTLFRGECSSRLIAGPEKAASRYSRYTPKSMDGSLLVGASLAPIFLPSPRNKPILL